MQCSIRQQEVLWNREDSRLSGALGRVPVCVGCQPLPGARAGNIRAPSAYLRTDANPPSIVVRGCGRNHVHWLAVDPGGAVRALGGLMKAIVYRSYGSPDVLQCEDVEKPSPGDDEVLIRIRAAA